MSTHTRRSLRFAVRTSLTAAAFILLLPSALYGQSSQSARDSRWIEMEMRQRALRNGGKVSGRRPEKPPDNRPAYRDVEEEFEQLQLRNYSLSRVAEPDSPLDYALVRKEAAEVRKRASRLQAYLALPEPAKGQKQNKDAEALTPEGLRAAVASLDALVKSFVWNPVFRRPDVVNLEQSSKAASDLEGILTMSEQIRRGAENLAKGAGKR